MRVALENSPTKMKLMDAAQELMLAKGYAATSVDEICSKAKVTKGSFFHYFDSKEELGKELLDRFCESQGKAMAEACCSEKDPLKRLYSFVDFLIKATRDPKAGKGCLLGMLSMEMSDTNPEIRSLCAQGFKHFAERMTEDIAEAKRLHAPKATFKPEELGQHFVAIFEGSIIIAKAKQDQSVVEKNLNHFKNYLQTLFKK